MSQISQIRILTGDRPIFDRQTATGDGATKIFKLSALPVITGSEAVSVGGAESTSPTDYILDPELGTITFAAAPADGLAVIATFSYAEISDEAIAEILTLQEDVYFAAMMAAQSISGRYANAVDKQVGDLRISYSQKAKAWADVAERIQRMPKPISASSPWFGGLLVDEKQAEAIDTSKVKPFFTRDMESNPYAADQTS